MGEQTTSLGSGPDTALDEDMSLWPLGKLAKAVGALDGASLAKGFAVVLTTGAMNPPHLGHAQLLHQAKARLEAEGYGVVGAWLSPSHDGYVQPKAKSLMTPGLSADFRLEVARCTTAQDEVVAVGSWEAKHPGSWPDFPVVTRALQAELEEVELLKGMSVTVFYACGTDHAAKCGLYHGLGASKGLGVVVVPRSGEKASGEKPDKLTFVAEPASGEVASFSSTKVRKALAGGDFEYVSKAMSPEAASFLLKPSESEFAKFKPDYKKLGIAAPA